MFEHCQLESFIFLVIFTFQISLVVRIVFTNIIRSTLNVYVSVFISCMFEVVNQIIHRFSEQALLIIYGNVHKVIKKL